RPWPCNRCPPCPDLRRRTPPPPGALPLPRPWAPTPRGSRHRAGQRSRSVRPSYRRLPGRYRRMPRHRIDSGTEGGKMEIAIIGAGNVGSALATSTVEAGHTVRIASNDRQEAEQVASATGATAAADNASAVQDAEVVILAVPVDALDGLADELGDSLAGKVVVDVTNRLNPEDPAATLDGTSAAEKLQARLPGVPVVKAFNTAFASRQAEPEVAGMRSDGFVAGDDEEAKQKVLGLVESIGFRPVDAGPLGMARALEAMATLNIYLQMRDEGSWQAAWKLVGPE